jgi:hypothetical protein
MELGYVYIITTHSYFKNDVFKIGCTKNLHKRLKELNASRFENDKFFVKMFWMTKRYYDLESGLHKVLTEYRKNNEFFQCSYQTIEDGLKLYLSEKPIDYIYDDAVLIPAFLHNLKWYDDNTISIYESYQVCLSEDELLHRIKSWLSPLDKCGLFKFAHSSFWEYFISLIKLNFKSQEFSFSSLDSHDEILSNIKNLYIHD